jgi:hypothetical protein
MDVDPVEQNRAVMRGVKLGTLLGVATTASSHVLGPSAPLVLVASFTGTGAIVVWRRTRLIVLSTFGLLMSSTLSAFVLFPARDPMSLREVIVLACLAAIGTCLPWIERRIEPRRWQRFIVARKGLPEPSMLGLLLFRHIPSFADNVNTSTEGA